MPEFAELLLEILHAAADVGGILGLAFLVNDRRQVPRDAHGIHRVEKEEAITAEQVLNIMLRCSDEDVDPSVIEQLVECLGIERDLFADLGVGNGHECVSFCYELAHEACVSDKPADDDPPMDPL